MISGFIDNRREAFEVATYVAWQTGRLGHADPKKYPSLKQLLEPTKPGGEKKSPAELLGTLKGLEARGIPMRIRKL